MKKTEQSQSNKKQTLVLLDAHAILHRGYHALPDFRTAAGVPTGALFGFVSMVVNIAGNFKPDYVVACYDLPGKTHRHDAYEDYKAGRKKTDDDLVSQLQKSKDLCEALNIPIYSAPGFEADDMLGTIVEQTKTNTNLQVIIASGDMDTLQLVDEGRVSVFTFKKGIRDTIIYGRKEVVERFGFAPELLPDYKGLRGDPSDNIMGVKGVGDKTAVTLISSFGGLEQIYDAIHETPQKVKAAGVTERIIGLLADNEEEAFFSKTLATIRRDAPITFVLPKETWLAGIDKEKVSAMFGELEFRTLYTRLLNLITPGEERGKEEIDPEKLAEMKIAVWLLDSNITNPDTDDILSFVRVDTLNAAHEPLMAELKKKGLDEIFNTIERPLIKIVEKMNAVGVMLDTEALGDLSSEYHARLGVLTKKIYELAGSEFNINSPAQLATVLFDTLGLKPKGKKKTQSGRFSTNEAVLNDIRDQHEIVGLVLDYRELQKLLSTYIDNLPKLVDDAGRIHATFIATGTTTGRMSSVNPNLQNIPIKSEDGKRIRNAFIAAPGKVLLSLDYSQIELRLAAVISGDERLIEAFTHNQDIHTAVAAAVFGVTPDEVTSEMRRRAKVINFGILYGMGVVALQKNLNVERKEAKEFLDAYFATYAGITKYVDEIKSLTARRGYTETLFGRRRYFAGFESRLPFIRAQAERMAINAPIQGSSADIIKLAMIQADEYITSHKLQDRVSLVLQIHDELIFELDKDLLSEFGVAIKNMMETVVDKDVLKGVPLKVDAEWGVSWGEMEDLM